MDPETAFEIVAKNFRAVLLASLLYPLDRIQAVQQVQTTFSSTALRTSPHIVSQALHFGRRSYFRGFLPFASRTALLTACVRLSPASPSSWSPVSALGTALAALGYALLYPLEVMQLRMSVQVENQRFYRSVGECMAKIKKNQGLKALFQGMPYGMFLFVLQLTSLQTLLRFLQQPSQDQESWRIASLVGIVGLSEVLFYPLLSLKQTLNEAGNCSRSMEPSGTPTATTDL